MAVHNDSMVVSKFTEQSRPPDQYLAVGDSLACLSPNEYDRNIYGECSYIGNRTLIKCRQVRRKEELAKNSGQCELHSKLSQSLKRRYNKEKARLSLEGQKKKYRKILQTEEVVSDEDDFLRPCSYWGVPKQDSVFFLSPEDDSELPIHRAGAYTDKEILKTRVALLQKEIKHLEMYRDITLENAKRVAECSLEPSKAKKKKASLDNAQIKDFVAKRSYQAFTVLNKRQKAMKQRTKIIPRYCAFGASEDNVVVGDVLGQLISDVAGDEFVPIRFGSSERCLDLSLPGSEFCNLHASKSGRFLSFPRCDTCNNIVLNSNDHGKNLCPVHALKASHRFPLSINIGTFSTRGSHPTSDVSPNLFVINSDSDDEFTNEIRQNFDISAIRAGKSRMRHSPYTSKYPGGPLMSPTQMNSSMSAVSIAHANQQKNARLKRIREVDSFRAARCRPFNRENFPEKTHRSAVSRTPTMCMSRPVRPSLPFNPTMPMKPRTFEPLKRSIPGAQNPQMRPLFTTQTVQRPQTQQRTFAPNMPSMSAYGARPHVPREASLMQRKQIEEDQKAAASILDEKGEEELVEDREPSPPSQHSALPAPTQRYTVAGSRIQAPTRGPMLRMPVRTTYNPMGIPANSQTRTVYRGVPMGDPKRMQTYTTIGQSTVPGVRQQPGPVRGAVQRNYSLTTRRPVGMPPAGTLDLSQLPPGIQDKPLGEVLKMQFQGRSVLGSPQKPLGDPMNVSHPGSSQVINSGNTMIQLPSKLPAPSAPNPSRPSVPIRTDEASRLPPHRLIKHTRPTIPAAPSAPSAPVYSKFVVSNAAPASAAPVNKPSIDTSAPRFEPRLEPRHELRTDLKYEAKPSLKPAEPPAIVTAPAMASEPVPSKETTQRKVSRVGQRRSSRLDKSYSDDIEKDPLSILAEQAIRGEDNPQSQPVDDDEEYEEEL